jgi:hypothetical protein
MKPFNRNLRFSIHVILLLLSCFAMNPSAMAGHIWQSEQGNHNEPYSSRTTADTLSQQADHPKHVAMRPLMVADSAASETGKAGSDAEADMEARRQEMIEHCKANRGVDCEKEVDTELGAEQLYSVPTSPEQTDNPIRARPRPRPKASY